jgi:hypothetical protein
MFRTEDGRGLKRGRQMKCDGHRPPLQMSLPARCARPDNELSGPPENGSCFLSAPTLFRRIFRSLGNLPKADFSTPAEGGERGVVVGTGAYGRGGNLSVFELYPSTAVRVSWVEREAGWLTFARNDKGEAERKGTRSERRWVLLRLGFNRTCVGSLARLAIRSCPFPTGKIRLRSG